MGGCTGRALGRWSYWGRGHDGGTAFGVERSLSHPAIARLVAAESPRTLGIPGAALLHGLARREGALQANSAGCRVGNPPTGREHAGVFGVLRKTGEDALRGYTLSGLRIRSAAAVATFRVRAN